LAETTSAAAAVVSRFGIYGFPPKRGLALAWLNLQSLLRQNIFDIPVVEGGGAGKPALSKYGTGISCSSRCQLGRQKLTVAPALQEYGQFSTSGQDLKCSLQPKGGAGAGGLWEVHGLKLHRCFTSRVPVTGVSIGSVPGYCLPCLNSGYASHHPYGWYAGLTSLAAPAQHPGIRFWNGGPAKLARCSAHGSITAAGRDCSSRSQTYRSFCSLNPLYNQ
jgi:hypothetical protein